MDASSGQLKVPENQQKHDSRLRLDISNTRQSEDISNGHQQQDIIFGCQRQREHTRPHQKINVNQKKEDIERKKSRPTQTDIEVNQINDVFAEFTANVIKECERFKGTLLSKYWIFTSPVHDLRDENRVSDNVTKSNRTRSSTLDKLCTTTTLDAELSQQNRQLQMKVQQLDAERKELDELLTEQARTIAEFRAHAAEERSPAGAATFEATTHEMALKTLGSIEAREEIEVLKQQVQTYLEDFRSERRDREMAQSRIAELETNLATLRTMLEESQSVRVGVRFRRRQDALERYRYEYNQSSGRMHYKNKENQYKGRYGNKAADGVVDDEVGEGQERNEADGYDELDIGPRATQDQKQAEQRGYQGADVLRCPTCRMVFSKSHHNLLIEHFEECHSGE